MATISYKVCSNCGKNAEMDDGSIEEEVTCQEKLIILVKTSRDFEKFVIFNTNPIFIK